MADDPRATKDRRFSRGSVLRGKYRVERVLGEGGMGVVLLATHLKLEQRVAVKVLRAGARGRAQLVARFAREARASAKLRNEHVVRVIDVDETEEGDPFLVMEYLVGVDLETTVARDGPLTPERAVDYVLQACEGIAEAHAVGIIHRDIKPANLFLSRADDGGEIVKVLDFGIAKAPSDDEVSLTGTNGTVGSPLYMSPEQLKGTRDVDARTDIWALGVVLYQLVSAKLPFEATSATGLAALIASEAPRPLRELRSNLPDVYLDVVDRCLRKDANERFGSVVELARAIAELAGASSARGRVSRVARAASARSVSLAETVPDPTSEEGVPSGGEERKAPRRVTAALSDGPGGEPNVGKATDYASEVLSKPSVAPPKERKRPWAVIAAGAVVIAVTATLLVRARSTQNAVPPRDPASAVSLLPPLIATDANVPPVISAATPPSSSSSAVAALPTLRSTSSLPPPPVAPALRPTPPASSSSKPAPRSSANPLDIDIQ